MDLIRPISPIGFLGKRYFFTFTDVCTQYTKIYTGTKKSDWLHSLKAFHNLAKTRTKTERPTERICSDYCSELQSKKVEQWLSSEEITLKPSASYSKKENEIAERLECTLIDMTRATIIVDNIDDCFWPEVILAMMHIKNLRLTSTLQGLNPQETLFHNPLDLTHLCVLEFTIYVLIYKEERELKSEKFVPQALRDQLVGFNGHTIYCVYIKEQKQVIRVKDLRIFEDTEIKQHTVLLNYKDGKPAFQGFLLANNDEKETSNTLNNSAITKPNISTDTGKPTASKDGAKPKVTKDTAKPESPDIVNQDKKSRCSRKIKPTKKTKDQNQELIAYLTILLEHD